MCRINYHSMDNHYGCTLFLGIWWRSKKFHNSFHPNHCWSAYCQITRDSKVIFWMEYQRTGNHTNLYKEIDVGAFQIHTYCLNVVVWIYKVRSDTWLYNPPLFQNIFFFLYPSHGPFPNLFPMGVVHDRIWQIQCHLKFFSYFFLSFSLWFDYNQTTKCFSIISLILA